MRARPTWMAVSAFLGHPPAAQTSEGRLLGGFGVLKPVEDPSAEVFESIRRKIPANRNLTLQAPRFRFLNPAPVWDERKFSSAAWKRLHENLAAQKIFREVRTDRTGDLIFRIVVTGVAPAEGMRVPARSGRAAGGRPDGGGSGRGPGACRGHRRGRRCFPDRRQGAPLSRRRGLGAVRGPGLPVRRESPSEGEGREGGGVDIRCRLSVFAPYPLAHRRSHAPGELS